MRWIAFGAVGALSFAVHYAVAIVTVEWGHGPPVAGTMAGYVCALGTSWLGQSRLTFADVPRDAQTRARFVLTSLCGLALNATIYAALLRYTSLDYRVALVLVISGVAVLTWMLFRRWVFSDAGVRMA
jgi:putative flippase GtrA